MNIINAYNQNSTTKHRIIRDYNVMHRDARRLPNALYGISALGLQCGDDFSVWL